MKILTLALMFFMTLSLVVSGQTHSNKPKHTKPSTKPIYIPLNLDDCIAQLDKIFADSSKAEIKAMTEDQFSARMHFNFGMWMRNNWGLWKGSSLSKFFNAKGIYHPDDMSGIILDSYYRHLTGQDIRLDEQIIYYQTYWEKVKQTELERIQKEFSQYHTGDTVLFNYTNGFVSKAQEDKFDKDICTAKGIVIEKNEEKYFVKVKLLESCDTKGIISYDSEDTLVYNKKKGKMGKPEKRIISYMKAGEENWFNYTDWEKNE